MPEGERTKDQRVMEQEGESFLAGPGAVGTKNQMRGGILGAVLGTVIGVILGVIVAAVFALKGAGFVIAMISFGLAGATSGFLSGGFVKPRQEHGGAGPEV